MMKAIVIVGSNLRLMPYAFFYIEALLKEKVQITVVYWDRDGLPDVELSPEIRVECFKAVMDDAIPKYRKVKNFVRFRLFVKKIILEDNYSFVIVLDTQFAVLISDILIQKFAGHFIYDMRDPSYENIRFYKRLVAKVVEASVATFISSDGYRCMLPKNEKIYTVNNIRMKDLEKRTIRNAKPKNHMPLRVSFWGVIRGVETNKALINELKNDERFELNYYGTITYSTRVLINYCAENCIHNVFFKGEYLPDQKYDFALNTDILHNVYENAYSSKNPCMGNKYYDGIIFKIPQICMGGGYMGKRVIEEKVGMCVKLNGNVADDLLKYYETIEWTKFETACDTALEAVSKEQEVAIKELGRIITDAKQK